MRRTGCLRYRRWHVRAEAHGSVNVRELSEGLGRRGPQRRRHEGAKEDRLSATEGLLPETEEKLGGDQGVGRPVNEGLECNALNGEGSVVRRGG